jgi:hypothetical protein
MIVRDWLSAREIMRSWCSVLIFFVYLHTSVLGSSERRINERETLSGRVYGIS